MKVHPLPFVFYLVIVSGMSGLLGYKIGLGSAADAEIQSANFKESLQECKDMLDPAQEAAVKCIDDLKKNQIAGLKCCMIAEQALSDLETCNNKKH